MLYCHKMFPRKEEENQAEKRQSMYHISNDKRAKKSAELIYQGLLACLEHKSFDQITVTDLQKASGVARTTFYRAFDNISDVLYWKCNLCFQEVLEGFTEEQFVNEMKLVRQYFPTGRTIKIFWSC